MFTLGNDSVFRPLSVLGNIRVGFSTGRILYGHHGGKDDWSKLKFIAKTQNMFSVNHDLAQSSCIMFRRESDFDGFFHSSPSLVLPHCSTQVALQSPHILLSLQLFLSGVSSAFQYSDQQVSEGHGGQSDDG